MKKQNNLSDLKIAHSKLIEYRQELERCKEDLKKANNDLDSGAEEKERRLKEVNGDLEAMMFTISHKIRKAVANILGISKLLCDDQTMDNLQLRELLSINIHSAESLNTSTEELSKFITLKKVN